MGNSRAPSVKSNAPDFGGVVVSPARFPQDSAEAGALLRAFHRFLIEEHNHDFPPIAEDADALPGEYAEPDGVFLLARRQGTILGCFALKRFDATTAEAKRMFIRPEGRGLGLGHALVGAVLEAARGKGYRRVLLDSLVTLPDAHRLYYKHGFALIDPYNDLPRELALHMECML